MLAQDPIFTTTTRWGVVVLMQGAWDHAVKRHQEIGPYLREVEQTLIHPNLVFELPHVLPTKAFYAKGLVSDPRYRDGYVAVIVRCTKEPAFVKTAYLPSRLAGNLGKLIHAER